VSRSRLQLKHLAAVSVSNVDKKSADGEIPVRLVNYTDVYYGDRLVPEMNLMKATATSRQVEAFRLCSGDVVITKDSETPEDIGVAAYVQRSADDMVLGYHLALLRPRREIDGRYLYWAMCSDDARGQLSTGATGVTRFGLRTDVIASVAVSAPSSPQQRVIAAFLDTETTRIDALITKKRRMIDLLLEHDHSLIEQELLRAATHELPLRRLLAELPQYGASEAGVDGQADWPRYIRITDLTDAGELRANGILRLPPRVAAPYLLADGDLLLARSGATVGKSFLYRRSFGPAAFAGYLIRFRPDHHVVSPDLLELWTRTEHYWSQVRLASLQATIENVSADKYKNFQVPCMALGWQEEIVRRLSEVRARSARARAAVTRQLVLLQEHRQALITAAVTGELEVPGVAA
jgi:type I restriction enzyme S subunit